MKIKLSTVRVVAFVGPAGTGKSLRAQLVARWKHLAAPAATAGASLEGRNNRKFGAPKKAK